jgi:hypothetical protein
MLARPGTTSTSAVLTPKLAVVWDSPDPTYDEGTIDRLAAALKLYTTIEARGGWPSVPARLTKLMPGVHHRRPRGGCSEWGRV